MKEGKLVQDDNTFGPEAADLLTKLLRYDPEQRIGCRE